MEGCFEKVFDHDCSAALWTIVVLTGFYKSSVRRFWNVSKSGGKVYQTSVKKVFASERYVNFWWRIQLHFVFVFGE